LAENGRMRENLCPLLGAFRNQAYRTSRPGRKFVFSRDSSWKTQSPQVANGLMANFANAGGQSRMELGEVSRIQAEGSKRLRHLLVAVSYDRPIEKIQKG
jgi:hypothetical protein